VPLPRDDSDVIIVPMGYNVDTVVKLAEVTARQVRYWDTSGLLRPSLHKARGRGSRRLYSFEDLVELRTVARLLQAGISLQKVRRVATHIRQVRDVDRPLARLRFLTDGEGVFVPSDDTKRWEDLLRGGQVVWIVPLDDVWRDTEAAVRRIGEPSSGTVRVGAKTYDVTFEPDLEDGGWVAECPALPGCVSQGETLAEARKMIRDAIATITAEPRARLVSTVS
jgi:predicted RNase H-like HicB family nuclease/DNA-binding transcriptional MerR regulator